MNPFLIGIAGGTSSGKSSIVRMIQNDLGASCATIEMDAYYKPYANFSLEERKRFNYDHPDAFDSERFFHDLRMLKDGLPIEAPLYDYVNYTRREETHTIYPHPVMIVEGLLVFWQKDLRDLLDLKVFVQADSDVRLIRRIRRDTGERGRSIESVLTQYESTVKPMHERFIEPTMKYADIIIPRGAHNLRGVEMLRHHLRRKLEDWDETIVLREKEAAAERCPEEN